MLRTSTLSQNIARLHAASGSSLVVNCPACCSWLPLQLLTSFTSRSRKYRFVQMTWVDNTSYYTNNWDSNKIFVLWLESSGFWLHPPKLMQQEIFSSLLSLFNLQFLGNKLGGTFIKRSQVCFLSGFATCQLPGSLTPVCPLPVGGSPPTLMSKASYAVDLEMTCMLSCETVRWDCFLQFQPPGWLLELEP